MKINIQNKEQYQVVMAQIEEYLQKVTKSEGFDYLDNQEIGDLQALSLRAEEYEDNILLLKNI